jgi:hypothetical protein
VQIGAACCRRRLHGIASGRTDELKSFNRVAHWYPREEDLRMPATCGHDAAGRGRFSMNENKRDQEQGTQRTRRQQGEGGQQGERQQGEHGSQTGTDRERTRGKEEQQGGQPSKQNQGGNQGQNR